MSRTARVARIVSILLIGGLAFVAERAVTAQQAAGQQATPEGYMPRGWRPTKGLAPGMKVTDLGKGGRTFRLNMTKGDEIMSGLSEFAEKYHIKNGHFTVSARSTRVSSGGATSSEGSARKRSSSTRKPKSSR